MNNNYFDKKKLYISRYNQQESIIESIKDDIKQKEQKIYNCIKSQNLLNKEKTNITGKLRGQKFSIYNKYNELFINNLLRDDYLNIQYKKDLEEEELISRVEKATVEEISEITNKEINNLINKYKYIYKIYLIDTEILKINKSIKNYKSMINLLNDKINEESQKLKSIATSLKREYNYDIVEIKNKENEQTLTN